MITVARDEKIKIYAINEIHKMKNRLTSLQIFNMKVSQFFKVKY